MSVVGWLLIKQKLKVVIVQPARLSLRGIRRQLRQVEFISGINKPIREISYG